MNPDLWKHAEAWYQQRGWQAFPFQREVAEAVLAGESGLLNAPTGSGKTYALWIPLLLDFIRQHPQDFAKQKKNGLQVLWITPLRALAKDICQANQAACDEMGLTWRVEIRTGDTSSSQKAKQKRSMPEGLVTTPESLHVLFSAKNHRQLFQNLQAVVVDEWHELLGTKRGVQTELGLAHLRQINPQLKVWGISATIGNLDEAMQVLLGKKAAQVPHRLVRAGFKKVIEVASLLPETVEKFPWAGHLGTNMVEQVLPIIEQSQSTLVFTNTRSQCELWYQALLAANPDLAGLMAMHHGSIDAKIRDWVENALHEGQLKVVVCTSSLDLGVDFRPVETIMQVGGPKGVARFIQRAGRSGHQPGATSRIHFVPTHSLELLEAAALRQAVETDQLEARTPIRRPYDVLLQYLMTLAVADGLKAETVFAELRQTFAYQDLTAREFRWALQFLTHGGPSLRAYDEYQKLVQEADGLYRPANKKIAMQHRLSIGTIVSDLNLKIKYLKGGRIGTIEESFISQVKPGDVFWFAGRNLELVRIRNNEVLVKRSKKKTGKVPRWMGSRMPLSSQMAELLRGKLDAYLAGNRDDIELVRLEPMLELQKRRSAIPQRDQCLMEYIESREGHHLFIYPFEGRVVHEIMGTLVAYRIAKLTPISFSIAMNDYGFELLSDQEIPIEEALEAGLFSPEGLAKDLTTSINETEMAVRRFREIAAISGLVFKGYPGRGMPSRHLQASTGLLFKVFQDHDPDNLLLKQAYAEVIEQQLDGNRLHTALERLSSKQQLFTRPAKFTPFCFPIMVDRLRERLSSEKLIDRVVRMQVQLER